MTLDLSRRGKSVEALFGFRLESRMALVPPVQGLILTDVAIAPDDEGIVRCRLGGQPAALVRVTETFWLNVTKLASSWPSLVSELVRRTDPKTALRMLGETPLLEPLDGDRLKKVILEHRIHAKDLHPLGDAPRAYAPLGEAPHFRLRFASGTLTLAYEEAAYRAACDPLANPFACDEIDVEVTWNERAIDPFRALGWDEAELAELAVIAHMSLARRPGDVLALLEAVFDESDSFLVEQASLAADLRASVLNLWGVALRRAGRLDEAVALLSRALPIASSANEKVKQEVLYNRGYARLETTMTSRVGPDGVGLAAFASHFAIEERHRETWRACLRDFEEALALDPADPSAESQVALTQQLLDLLERGGAPPSAPRPERPRARKVAPAQTAARPSTFFENWIGLIVAVAILIVVAIAVLLSPRNPRPFVPPTTRAAASAPNLSEQARQDALASPDHGALVREPTSTRCPISPPPPPSVTPGDVIAPHLARGIGTGELYGTDYFDATVRNYLLHYASYADALALDPTTGPLHDRWIEAPGSYVPRGPYRLTILVTSWRDPVILENGASLLPGEIGARLLVWSYSDSRFVCATSELHAENASGLVIVRAPLGAYDVLEDDPLNRARLDLIEQALRTGLPQLATLDDAPR